MYRLINIYKARTNSMYLSNNSTPLDPYRIPADKLKELNFMASTKAENYDKNEAAFNNLKVYKE